MEAGFHEIDPTQVEDNEVRCCGRVCAGCAQCGKPERKSGGGAMVRQNPVAFEAQQKAYAALPKKADMDRMSRHDVANAKRMREHPDAIYSTGDWLRKRSLKDQALAVAMRNLDRKYSSKGKRYSRRDELRKKSQRRVARRVVETRAIQENPANFLLFARRGSNTPCAHAACVEHGRCLMQPEDDL